MLFLILCILCCTIINIVFKYADKYGKDSFYIILVNYLFATATGIVTSEFDYKLIDGIFPHNLFLIVVLGVLFIVMIYLISLSVAKAGVSKTAIATRMSLILPVIFSFAFFGEKVSLLKFTGIAIGLMALYLTLYRKDSKNSGKASYLLPVIIFIGAGTIDTIVKYSQVKFVNDNNLAFFSTLIFFFAGISGIVFMLAGSKSWKVFNDKWIWIYGAILGVANYGTVFFFVKALEIPDLSTSVVFGINHISIVLLSVFAAYFLFREKLHFINWTGVLLSVLAIILLIY